ncbi:hypothetical protein EYR36_001884 [Pleurotus pulmonarius]|nr:hypothetical protein EYR36_001884 [Pleurotus pulmonarius]KAF4588361.1 hypothetical protein EYR38_010329 [Pleurotus pulmonarius]
MGGIVVIRADGQSATAHPRDFVFPDPVNIPRPLAWPSVALKEIKDKSKGDALAKAIIVLQTSYFLIQLFARVAQRLTITKLEIMTLAYALLCGILYLFWWHKPYNVQLPIFIRPEFERGFSQLCTNPDDQPNPDNQSSSVDCTKHHLTRIFNGGFILDLHNYIIGEHLQVLKGLHDADTELCNATSTSLHRTAMASSLVTATAFGGVHCIAWEFEFTTHAERLVWDISAMLIASIPIVWTVLVLLRRIVDKMKGRDHCRGGMRNWVLAMLRVVLSVLLLVVVCAYFTCRIILIVQSFMLLRDLSPGARAVVDWSSLIPHI